MIPVKYLSGVVLTSMVVLGAVACGDASAGIPKAKAPSVGDSFDWRLDNVNENTQIAARVIDVDAFETSKESIRAWHKKGIAVIAYLSVGTWDRTRSDANAFAAKIIGKGYPTYPDEFFIDIRDMDAVAPLMQARLDMIKAKGFDGIEPDNIDLYVFDAEDVNGTGFGITEAESRVYMDFLIEEAHKRGLSIGQKNVNELAPLYVDKFDWALAEEAFEGNITKDFEVYPAQQKPVFAVEYTDGMDENTFLSEVCPKAKVLQFTAILKDRKLDAYIRTCP